MKSPIRLLFNWLVDHKARAVSLSIGWAALILFACLLPGKDVPSLTIFQYDKLVHFGIFGVLAFCWLAVWAGSLSLSRKLIVLIGCSAYGVAVELLQGSGLVSGRSCDMYDALADAIGAAIGIVLFSLLWRLWRKPTS